MKKANFATVVLLKKIAELAADVSYGSASILGMYQPKEPMKPTSLKK